MSWMENIVLLFKFLYHVQYYRIHPIYKDFAVVFSFLDLEVYEFCS